MRPLIYSKEESRLRKNEYQKQYKKSEKGKATQTRYYCSQAKHKANKRWQDKNRLKHNIHNLVWRAIKTSKLLRQPCDVCSKRNAFAHHDDYSKPFEIKWFCNFHHSLYHRN